MTSTKSADQVYNPLKNLSASYAASGHSQYSFWTGIWAAEVLHTAGNTDIALNYLINEAPMSYDDVSEMVFTRFSCQMEYELVAEFPTYEEWYSQMTLCGDTNQSDSKSGDEESTSSKPQIESSMVNLFPNPNSGHFFLELTGEVQDVQLNIYDLKGRKLGQVVNFKGGAIDLSNLTGGVYILQVYDGTRYEKVRRSIIK